MSTEWIDSLRVVDLKDELKKRDLPVSGKKAELSARLKEAVEAVAKPPADAPAEQAADEKAQEAADLPDPPLGTDQEGLPADSTEAVAHEAPAEEPVQEVGTEDVRAKAEESRPEAKLAVDPDDNRPDLGAQQEKKPSSTPQASEPKVLEVVEVLKEPAVDVDPKSEKRETKAARIAEAGGKPIDPVAILLSNDRQAAAPEPAVRNIPDGTDAASEQPGEEWASIAPFREDRLPSMQAALLAPQPAADQVAQDTEMGEAVDFEADDVEEPAVSAPKAEQKAKETSAVRKGREHKEPNESPLAKRAKQEPPQESEDLLRSDSNKRKREPITFKPREKSATLPVKEDVSRSDSVEARPLERRSSVFDRIGSLNSEDRRMSGPGAPPTRTKATRALLVTGFIRPFTVTAAQNLFKSYGEVQAMWMPMIRDKAYIVFATEESAEAARQGTYGLEWPHGNRTSLRPKFIPVEEAEEVVKSEGKNLTAPSTQQPAQPVAAPSAAAAKPGVSPAIDAGPERRRPDRGTGSESNRSRAAAKPAAKEKAPEKVVTLEDLFRKTSTAPHLYWVSLTDEQVVAKQKTREQKVRTDHRGRV